MIVNIVPETSSFSKVTVALRRRKDAAIYAGILAVHDTADLVFTMSQLAIPRKTGALAASGNVDYEDTNRASVATISYGTSLKNPLTGVPTADYAVAKHEAPVNGKWLENAILDCSDLYRTTLESRISKALSE